MPCALPDRKSTRLNSSHLVISYAVFCLKKKKRIDQRAAPTASPPEPLRMLAPLPHRRPRPPPRAYGSVPGGSRRLREPSFIFFLMMGRPPSSTLFPYATLSR